ncbi:MAG TPA: HEAT repeat domain-containing protein, partial [Gemmatales bacterium]|nr:HEAT repeat domain-containing protein [Gemmatales bacterium]
MKSVLSKAEGFVVATLILFSLFGAASYCAFQAIAQEGILSFPTTWRGFINTITSKHDLDPVDLDIDELLADLQKSHGTRKAQIMRDLGLGVSNKWAQSAIPVLLNEVENLQNTGEVRLEAVKSLVSLAGHARQSSLIPMIRLLGDQDGMIRQQAIEFLVRIGRDARQPLLQQLKSQNDKRFAAAAMALSYYPDVSLDSVVARLENLIWHPDIMVRT